MLLITVPTKKSVSTSVLQTSSFTYLARNMRSHTIQFTTVSFLRGLILFKFNYSTRQSAK